MHHFCTEPDMGIVHIVRRGVTKWGPPIRGRHKIV
jgi:hypothetical protein